MDGIELEQYGSDLVNILEISVVLWVITLES